MASTPPSLSCPSNSIQYNNTLCACNPGYLFDATTNHCTLFQSTPKDWTISTGIDYSISFSVPLFSFDDFKKLTQSQTVLLEATAVLLVVWLLFCLVLRCRKVCEGDGNTIWFRIRWWVSRLDVCYATRHWLDDQKVVRKRKTELGGTFSIASWIVFIGLFAAFLYQIISNRTVEVHTVRATNGPDLLSFINDMEFNITTISSMSCSHLRGLGTLVTGTPGFIDYRASPLSIFANYSCHNTSRGPTIMLKCSNCKLARDVFYVSWQFVDLPNEPAMAVGFVFNFTAKNLRDKNRVSFVTGTVMNGSNMDARPKMFRGPDVNILKFNLLPRIYRNLRDLRLIQPLYHDFIPGSSFLGASQLQASLQNSQDGLINTTLAVNLLSSYIIEIDTENILGPVRFFADLGGLYAFSFAIFYYFLMQCEYRIKKIHNEDIVLLNIRNRTKAKHNWDKLRKYVMYTWDVHSLKDANEIHKVKSKSRSLHKRKRIIEMDTISLNKKGNLPIDTNTCPKPIHTDEVKSFSTETPPDLESGLTRLNGEHFIGHEDPADEMGTRSENSVGSFQNHVSQPEAPLASDSTVPLPPILEYTNSGTDISDIQRNLQNLYEYNVLLREKFIASQSKLGTLAKKASDPHFKCHL